jgi:hypothetical protein
MDVQTAKQLRDYLAFVPDDTPVVLARDAEANGLGPLAEVDKVLYHHWEREVYPLPEQIGQGIYTEADRAPAGSIVVIALYPA